MEAHNVFGDRLLSRATSAVPCQTSTRRTGNGSAEAAARKKGASEFEEIGLDTEIYFPPVDEDWADAWRVTEGILLLLSSEVEAHGAKLLVVTLSNAAQVNPDPIEQSRFEQQLGVTDLFYADRRIKGFGDQHGLNVLNLAETMQRDAQQNKVYFHGFNNTQLGSGHWNSKGHEFAARLIGQRIRQMCRDAGHD